MIRFLAQAISVLFQPLLLTSYLFVSIFIFHPLLFSPLSWEAGQWVVLLLVITTFAIPLLGLIALRLFSNLRSLQMPERQDRIVPFIFISGFYVVTTMMVWDRLNLHPLMMYLLISVSILICSITLVTLKFKISAHAAGISGIFGYFWAFSFLYPSESFAITLAIISILVGLVLSARLYLNAHTIEEIFWGTLLGFCVCFFSILLLL